MFVTIIKNTIKNIKTYSSYSLAIFVITSLALPVSLYYNRMHDMSHMEKYYSLLYDDLKKEECLLKSPELLVCGVTQCSGYEKNGVVYVIDSSGEIKKTDTQLYPTWYDILFIFDIQITSNQEVIKFQKDYFSYFIEDFKTFIIFQILIFILSMYIFSLLSRKESILYKKISEKESTLLNNIMTIYITENLHHELLTPVKVIMSKTRVLRGIIRKEVEISEEPDIDMHEENIEKSKESIDYIELSIEQIHSILENMRQAKMVKKSSNETIHDIIEHALGLIDIITTNDFKYHIDDALDECMLDHISTGAFLNIILNHSKNSIEANSDNIRFEMIRKKNNFLYLDIIDDGTGIPDDIKKHLFEADTSSKEDAEARGNGLFLNKMIMSRYEGDISLVHTSEKGTTFELKIPVTDTKKCSDASNDRDK